MTNNAQNSGKISRLAKVTMNAKVADVLDIKINQINAINASQIFQIRNFMDEKKLITANKIPKTTKANTAQ